MKREVCRIQSASHHLTRALKKLQSASSVTSILQCIVHILCYLWAQSLFPLQRSDVGCDEVPSVRIPAHFVDCTQFELEDNGVTGVEMVFCRKLQQLFVKEVLIENTKQDKNWLYIHFISTQNCHLVVKSIPSYPQCWMTWMLPWPELLAPTSSVSCPPDIISSLSDHFSSLLTSIPVISPPQLSHL